MAKGLHLERHGRRSDAPGAARRHAYLEVATALNNSVHKNEFERDINKREVTRMIDKFLEERKGIVGKGGYMERSTRGRITRGLKRLWDRTSKFDYDGSKIEWKLWRKAKVMEKERIAKGAASLGDFVEEREIAQDDALHNDCGKFTLLIFTKCSNTTN
jgi:hypothetical protein